MQKKLREPEKIRAPYALLEIRLVNWVIIGVPFFGPRLCSVFIKLMVLRLVCPQAISVSIEHSKSRRNQYRVINFPLFRAFAFCSLELIQ